MQIASYTCQITGIQAANQLTETCSSYLNSYRQVKNDLFLLGMINY